MKRKWRAKRGVEFLTVTGEDGRFWAMVVVPRGVAPKDYQVTVTSAGEGFSGDGVHKEGSSHYLGWALDLRIRDFPGTKYEYLTVEKTWTILEGEIELKAWIRKIASKLGSRYTVILEIEKMHIHIQFNG